MNPPHRDLQETQTHRPLPTLWFLPPIGTQARSYQNPTIYLQVPRPKKRSNNNTVGVEGKKSKCNNIVIPYVSWIEEKRENFQQALHPHDMTCDDWTFEDLARNWSEILGVIMSHSSSDSASPPSSTPLLLPWARP